MSVTRNDVARKAGVSTATVSYVINNGPRPVAPETRKRVLAAIRELGYQPNAVARNLRLQRTSLLGLIMPDTRNPYFADVARGIEQVAFENGYTVMLCHSGYDLQRELQYVDMLHIQRVAGVIWVPATDHFDPYYKLMDYDVPTVVVDRLVPNVQSLAVLADNFHGGYLATEHLIQLGHWRIAFISRPVELSHSQERLRGYLAALADHGIPADPALIARGGFRMEDGYQAMEHLLKVEDPPTGLFAYNDIMALGALRALYDHGIAVPRDFSLVGFDDIGPAAFSYPSLTTVCMPKFEMGQRGAQLLLAFINRQDPPGEWLKPLPVHLIVRESTAPARPRGFD